MRQVMRFSASRTRSSWERVAMPGIGRESPRNDEAHSPAGARQPECTLHEELVEIRVSVALRPIDARRPYEAEQAAGILQGRRAGVATCAVRYGYGDPAELARSTPDYWIDDPRELLGSRTLAR